MPSSAEVPAAPHLRDRVEIPDRFKWNLTHIFPDWADWQAAFAQLDTQIGAYAALQGTLAQGPDRLLAAMKLSDDIGQLTYKVWYFASLKYDEDQRDNAINARRQQVQILFAKATQASAWFNPELLKIPLPTVQQWMAGRSELAMYRFALEDLYRQQEHVLDDKGEHLLSLSSRFSSSPNDVYAALSTADIKHPALTLSSGSEVTLTYGQYRAILATNRHQEDRAAAFTAYHQLFAANINTYASLYNGVLAWLPASVEPLGREYQRHMRDALASGWIDVYENPGKRSGAYSAPVYGVHPYMLLNYNDTLDAVFTLAHEMGHSMHTLLSHAHQPFVYASYTIFVAEVPSTLSEALFLDYMLARATDERERIVLLQHAIDGIVSTFYTQVLFADYERQTHLLIEEGKPVTAEVLSEIYFDLLKAYHGDAMDYDDLSRITWARIPHFFSTPYYVYQYATCFASSAQLMKQLTTGSDSDRAKAIERYLTLLKSGGSDHPMTLLQRAGVDLSKPETVRAVVDQLDRLVTQLERAIAKLA